MAKAKTTNTSKKTTPAPKKRAVNAVTSAKKTPLENTKKYRELYENEQRATLELTLINNLTRAVLESQDLEQVLLELAANLAKLLQADDCYITRWDSKNNIPIPQATTAKLKTPFSYIPRPDEISMTASALDAGHALMAEDVFNSPYISPEIAERYPARSLLGIPLIYREHKLGAAMIAFNTPHTFTPAEIQQAERTTSHIAIAIWNAQQEGENKQRLKEQDTLAKITTTLSQTERVGLPNVLDLIVHSARELIPSAQQAVIHLEPVMHFGGW